MRTRLMLSVVGCHAEGEVGDVIVGGFLAPPGATMFERMRAMERDFDHVRRFLLCEPRGSVCRHVNLLTPPLTEGCDVGVIIMEPTEYVPMSGSNLICTVTVVLETGLVPIKEPRDNRDGGYAGRAGQSGRRMSRWKVPLGRVRERSLLRRSPRRRSRSGGSWAPSRSTWLTAGCSTRSSTRPSSAFASTLRKHASSHVRASKSGSLLASNSTSSIRRIPGFEASRSSSSTVRSRESTRSREIRASSRRADPTAAQPEPARAPRMAVLHARGQMAVGDAMIHESLIGSQFHGRIVSTTSVGRRGRRSSLPSRAAPGSPGSAPIFSTPTTRFLTVISSRDSWGVTGKLKQ